MCFVSAQKPDSPKSPPDWKEDPCLELSSTARLEGRPLQNIRWFCGLNSWMAMVVGIRVRSALDIPVHMKPLRRSEAPPFALGVAKKLLCTDYKQQRSPTTGGTRCSAHCCRDHQLTIAIVITIFLSSCCHPSYNFLTISQGCHHHGHGDLAACRQSRPTSVRLWCCWPCLVQA